MRVFVAGATGVLGRRAILALVAGGHAVTAVVRSPAKAALARSLGATPVEVSLFDPDALRAAASRSLPAMPTATSRRFMPTTRRRQWWPR